MKVPQTVCVSDLVTVRGLSTRVMMQNGLNMSGLQWLKLDFLAKLQEIGCGRGDTFGNYISENKSKRLHILVLGRGINDTFTHKNSSWRTKMKGIK